MKSPTARSVLLNSSARLCLCVSCSFVCVCVFGFFFNVVDPPKGMSELLGQHFLIPIMLTLNSVVETEVSGWLSLGWGCTNGWKSVGKGPRKSCRVPCLYVRIRIISQAHAVQSS